MLCILSLFGCLNSLTRLQIKNRADVATIASVSSNRRPLSNFDQNEDNSQKNQQNEKMALLTSIATANDDGPALVDEFNEILESDEEAGGKWKPNWTLLIIGYWMTAPKREGRVNYQMIEETARVIADFYIKRKNKQLKSYKNRCDKVKESKEHEQIGTIHRQIQTVWITHLETHWNF